MKLKFQSSYLSISAFPEIDLPDLTVITGPNGVGKSHLLGAINAGHIKTDVSPNHPGDNLNKVRIFDWNNMVPHDQGVYTSEILKNERVNLLNSLNNAKRFSNMESLRNFARQSGLDQRYVSNPNLMASLLPEDFGEGDATNGAPLFTTFLGVIRQIEQQMIAHIDVNSRTSINAVAERVGKKSFIFLEEEDILSKSATSWGSVDIFQQSFARLFVAYRDLKLSNMIAELKSNKGGASTFLSEADFLHTYGPPPWDFVNASIAGAGLDFRINEPSPYEFSPFSPQLTKVSTEVRIPFAALSSGEKVLMSFAFCVYYSNDRRQLATCPAVILFDEIDAPLHPSMSKNLIETIEKSLIKDLGIKVIMTTHSPSTVALAPDESVYVMRRNEPGLRKCGRSEALNVLTFGVPTLAISFEGRRQVFVESPSDAKNYEAIYKILKPRITSERSLEFI